MPLSSASVIDKLMTLADPKIALHSQRFFKTGAGEYGEGDFFLGIRVPVIRKQVKLFNSIDLASTLSLLKNKYHEIRLFAVLMLVHLYKQESDMGRQKVYNAYLKHSPWVNNWDLVDCSAHKIVGVHLLNKSREPLYQLAKSQLLWDRRIAMIACYHLIKQDDFEDTLNLASLLIEDTHDLIHKAVGWMLREIGKRDFETENQFLAKHYQNMPRTMLRYAIEKFPLNQRLNYLNNKV